MTTRLSLIDEARLERQMIIQSTRPALGGDVTDNLARLLHEKQQQVDYLARQIEQALHWLDGNAPGRAQSVLLDALKRT